MERHDTTGHKSEPDLLEFFSSEVTRSYDDPPGMAFVFFRSVVFRPHGLKSIIQL